MLGIDVQWLRYIDIPVAVPSYEHFLVQPHIIKIFARYGIIISPFQTIKRYLFRQSKDKLPALRREYKTGLTLLTIIGRF